MVSHEQIVNDRFARGIIRRKVRQFVGRAGFTDQDTRELEQELLLRLIDGLRNYNPDLTRHLNAFITTVVERAFVVILRDRRAQKRDVSKHRSIHGLLARADRTDSDAGIPDPTSRSDAEWFELTDDVAGVLAALPDDLRALAERLKRQSVSEVARELRIPRTTLYRNLERLRRHFADAHLRDYL